MPVKFGLWKVDADSVSQVATSGMASEEQLEGIIEQRLEILGLDGLLLIGRQVFTEFGKKIDLLAINAQGDLYMIELKKDRTPREVVAQALEYGFWIQDLSFEAISELFSKHHDGEDFDSAFTSRFEEEIPEAINNAHHLVVVANGMDLSTEQIVDYLREYGVPINVLFFEYFEDDGREYLARSWLADPESSLQSGSVGKKQPPWNGIDFFVAVGENQHRNWDDMRNYGFVSAGHGEKYRKAMANLFDGARVWASIPGTGYVGVGEVVAPAVRIRDFSVQHEGKEVPILDAPLSASHMFQGADDADESEYLARIKWLATRPRDQAIWEKGMFANQNVVARLRQPYTRQRLGEIFEVD